MYYHSTTCIRTTIGNTKSFLVGIGLHQGSTLSPYIFVLIMDVVSLKVHGEVHGVCFLQMIFFLVAESMTGMNVRLDIWKIR